MNNRKTEIAMSRKIRKEKKKNVRELKHMKVFLFMKYDYSAEQCSMNTYFFLDCRSNLLHLTVDRLKKCLKCLVYLYERKEGKNVVCTKKTSQKPSSNI